MRGGPRDDVAAGEARARLARELGRLDAYSFWVMPATAASAGDLIVVGATGVFLVAACGLPGGLRLGRRPVVGDEPIPVRPLRAAAKKLSGRLSGASVFVTVEPVVVLTRATTGAPTSAGGLRFVHVADLVTELAGRARALSLQRAQRAARVLGMQLAGDEERHFSVRN